MKIGNHETHELADAFPLMEGAALDGLVDDIKANGLRQPIVLYAERILDGRNRYRACLLAKVEPRFEVWQGDESELPRFVISVNMARRDLDPGQRALCARRLERLIKGDRKSKRSQPQLPGVRTDTLEQADAVLANAEPEVIAAVDRGDIALEHAAEVAKLEPDQQRAVVERVLKQDEPEPIRAKQRHDGLTSQSREFSPTEAMAWKAGVLAFSKSVHAELRECSRLMAAVLST
jgi:ParB-like chromosome segregation protein Spo0J